MNATKITEEELTGLRISNLPTRPTSPAAYGGLGYTSAQMKAAFDALPLFIIERLNALLDDLSAEGAGAVSSEIKTGLSEGHTLYEMFSDIGNGGFASYLDVGGRSLLTELSDIKVRLSELEAKNG